ncbi:MAG: hypothetical protein D6718_02895 [Acidobacteria bacterium]|nr:MAG: hypothetical protein D6718_02895 [Acidobacteriota bacterium]
MLPTIGLTMLLACAAPVPVGVHDTAAPAGKTPAPALHEPAPNQEDPNELKDDGLTASCTCRCGTKYTKVDPKPGETCTSIEGDECVTDEGELSRLSDCGERYVSNDSAHQNLPSQTR